MAESTQGALDQEFDFYRGAGRGDVLDQLGHLAAWARSLVMLTGPLGAGKSILLEQVVARVGATNRTLIVRPPVGFLSTGHEMLRHVVADLGAKVTDNLDEAALQRLVMQHIVAELANDRSTLLLLDDAHELSSDVLRTVAQLVDDARDSRALNVLLAGEPSLPEQLKKATTPRENWHEIRLRPFALNDVRVFLRQRLPQSAASLDAAGLQALARKTGGWPGRVLDAFSGQRRRRRWFPRRVPLVHVAWLLGLCAALGTVVWLQRAPSPETPVAPTQVETLSLPGTGAGEAVASNGSGVSLRLPGEKPVDPRSLLPPSQQIPVPKPPDALGMPAPPPPPVITVPGSRPATTVLTPPVANWVPPVAGVPGSPAANTLANAAAPASQLPRPEAGAAVPAASAKQPAAVPRIALPKPEPSPATPAEPAARQLDGAIATVAPAPRAGSNDDGWINQQPPANFTVQLMGVSAASAAQSYVRRHPNAGLRIVRTVRNGSDWYVVVQGSYRGRGEAQAALRSLSDASIQPWVRTLDGIQRDAGAP